MLLLMLLQIQGSQREFRRYVARPRFYLTYQNQCYLCLHLKTNCCTMAYDVYAIFLCHYFLLLSYVYIYGVKKGPRLICDRVNRVGSQQIAI